MHDDDGKTLDPVTNAHREARGDVLANIKRDFMMASNATELDKRIADPEYWNERARLYKVALDAVERELGAT